MNRTTRTPLIAVSLVLASTAIATAAPKPNPLVVLWAGSQPDDVAAMSAVRRSLRERGHVDVITYDVENPAVLRASRDTNHLEWVGDSLTGADRAALGKAMGASLVIIVSRGEKNDTAVLEMSSTADASQVTRAQGKIRQDAEAIENLIAHPERAAKPAPAPTPITPVVTAPPVAPAPAPPAPAATNPVAGNPTPTAPEPAMPVAAAPAPATPVAAAPAPAEPVAAAPPVTNPVAAAPVATVPVPAAPIATTPPPEKPAPKRPLVTLKPTPPANDAPKLPAGAGDSPDNPITVGDTPDKPITIGGAPAKPAVVGGAPNKPVVKGGDSPDNPIVVTTKDPVAATNSATGATAQDPEMLRAVAPMIAKGDQALDRDEVAVAISYYRQAVDGAPLFAEPRLKLAKAYLQGGFEDKAVDEAKRALMIAPDNVAVQEFLIQMDANSSTASGTVTLYEALIAKNPDNLDAHLGLGDAYWNSGALDRAEAEYEKAETLAPKGDVRPASQLVRLFVAQSRYGDAIPVLKRVGPNSYRIAARVMHSRLDTLMSTLSSGREAFAAGKSSHEQFYDTSKTVSVQANALADFIDKVQPPAEYKVSHLHLSLAASLIAQEAEVLRTFIETSDPDQQDHAVQLEKSAQSEMLTAHAAEEKSGLFAEKS